MGFNVEDTMAITGATIAATVVVGVGAVEIRAPNT
jgi:hypothetical protein